MKRLWTILLVTGVLLAVALGCAPAPPPTPTPAPAKPAAPAPAPTAAPAKPAAPAPTTAPAKPAAPAPTTAPAKPAAAPAAQTFRMRLGLQVSVKALSGEMATTLADRAKEKSNGRIIIDIFDNSQLGSEAAMVAALRGGELDFTVDGMGFLGTIEPSFFIPELPYIWKSPDLLHSLLDGPVGQNMLSRLEAKGIKGLVFGEWGPRALLVKQRPVRTVDDLKGLKIRVVESPIYVSTWRALGANPTPMGWPEVYTALQQGTIDAVDAQPHGLRDAKHYEVAKNLAMTDHIYTANLLVMNPKKWQSLPSDVQQVIADAAKEGQKLNRERVRSEQSASVELMQKNGVQVTRPDAAPFRARVADVYKQFEPQVDAALLKQVLEMNK